MHSRVHQALDGEILTDQLNEQERAEFEEVTAFFDGVIRAIPDPALPPLGPEILRRISTAPAPPAAADIRGVVKLRKALGWLTAPRPVIIDWRPAYGLGIAAAAAVLLLFAPDRGVQPPADRPAPGNVVLVQFRLDAPNASRVALAGDFTAWKPAYTLRRSESGVWTVVVPLQPGVHDYAFVVDGERWLADPMAPAVADGFGGLNSRLAVFASDQGSGT